MVPKVPLNGTKSTSTSKDEQVPLRFGLGSVEAVKVKILQTEDKKRLADEAFLYYSHRILGGSSFEAEMFTTAAGVFGDAKTRFSVLTVGYKNF